MIALEQVTKRYTMGNQNVDALKQVSIEIGENELVAITGVSGSGKSTMMNILGCLDRASSGKFLLDGEDVSSLDENSLAKIRNDKLGFVFQSFHLLPKISALDNVMLPLLYKGVSPKEREKRATEALIRVGLEERIKHKPAELSGGQRQRVAIARALVNQPTLILADEPTGNLDSQTTQDILTLFDDLHRQGQTIVMVTHELEVANRCQRIIKMLDGEVASDIQVSASNSKVHYNA